jgi:tetratricopeptide (TPR) repeat protein
LAIRRATGDEPGIAEALNNIGDALVPQGEFEEAMRVFDESLELRRATGDVRASITLRHIATVSYHRGELPAAQARLEEALATQTRIGQKVEAAMTRAALARTFLAQGEAARAVATAQQAVTELHDTQNPLEQAVALRVMALAQLAAGDPAGASESVRSAQETLGNADTPSEQLALGLAAAMVRAAQGEAMERELSRIVAAATKFELWDILFDARLARAEDFAKAGHADAAAELAAIESAAASKGFLLVARNARAAREKLSRSSES